MKEIESPQPSRFVETSPPSASKTDATVDKWFADHFHGEHHLRAIANPHDYISRAVVDLKRRLKEA